MNAEQRLARAIGLYNAGQRSQAREEARRALPHPAADQLLAVICLDDGEPQAAADHAEASLRTRPGHAPTARIAAQAWFALSLRAHDEGRPQDEENALEQALARFAHHVEANVNLGILRQSQGRLDEAMALYGRACELRPDSFGRIAHALSNEPRGALWLQPQALREALRKAAAEPAREPVSRA